MNKIDVDRAIVLRELTKTWDEVGAILADEELRLTPYRGTSVVNAVGRRKRDEE